MRIGIFSNCYHPLVNGVVGVVSLLRKGFLEKGHQVYIFAPAVDDYIDKEAGIYRYRSVDLTREVKYPVAIPFSPRINKILSNLDLDVIHSHHPFVLGQVALKTARHQKIPIIYTFHTQYEQYNHYFPLPGKLVNLITRAKVKAFCQSVNGLTTPAESARQLLINYGITNPVAVIPNPTVITRETETGEQIKKRYGLKDDKILVTVGRIAPEKNLGLLLQSFQYMLSQSLPHPLRLMIVGDGPELENLKKQARILNIADRVIFTGLVIPEQVPQYLAAADLFVMTSTSEVKPLAQLESLAAGLPIVAVAAAGANDTIIHGENGLLVTENYQAIADSVIDLVYNNDKLSNFRLNALNTAKLYSYPRIAEKYLELYREKISESASNKS